MPEEDSRARLDTRWYGWDSPVGLGLLILAVGIAVAAVIAASH